MAPLLGSPMTPIPASMKTTPRKIVPIVPAIPRRLERKPKRNLTPEPSVPQEAKGASVSAKEHDTPTEKSSVTLAQDLHGGEQEEVATDANTGAFEVKETSIANWAEEVEEAEENETKGESAFQSLAPPQTLTLSSVIKTPSTSTTQDFGRAKHGFKLLPPFCPKRSPPAAISIDIASANGPTDSMPETKQSPQESIGSGRDQQIPAKRRSPLRGAAPSFHAHTTPPSDFVTSPTASPYRGHALQPISSHPQPTPPTDVAPSPVQLPYHSYSTAHNISFYPPPPQY